MVTSEKWLCADARSGLWNFAVTRSEKPTLHPPLPNVFKIQFNANFGVGRGMGTTWLRKKRLAPDERICGISEGSEMVLITRSSFVE